MLFSSQSVAFDLPLTVDASLNARYWFVVIPKQEQGLAQDFLSEGIHPLLDGEGIDC